MSKSTETLLDNFTPLILIAVAIACVSFVAGSVFIKIKQDKDHEVETRCINGMLMTKQGNLWLSEIAVRIVYCKQD